MKKVLVIDDSPEINELVSENLQINGYKVFVAEDGVTGVQLAQRHLPDLILCDIRMPNLDGYATLTALRQQSCTATIPFIFLTAVTEKINVRQGMELGADDYLTKPFSIAELLAAVKARLDKQSTLTRQAERKLEELRGNISLALPHELLTPLNAIVDCSSTLADRYDRISPPELFDLAGILRGAALRLQRIVENFLLYTQIELVAAEPAKVEALRTGEFVLPVSNVMDLARAMAKQAGRDEDLQVRVEPGPVTMAPDRLHKVLAELLDNAFKFSRPGDAVVLASFATENNFTLTVTDHGCGMTPDQISKVGAHMQFERKLCEQQGSGLGLMIAKRLTELHGANFRIESLPDQGTSIHLTFPRFLVVSPGEL